MLKFILLTVVICFASVQGALAQGGSCSQIFAKANFAPLQREDDLLAHIFFVSQVDPNKLEALKDVGISSQVVAGVQRLYDILTQFQKQNDDLADVGRMIMTDSLSHEELAEAQKWQRELQADARNTFQQYEAQKKSLVQFLKTHTIYPKYDGIFLDITLSEGPSGSDVFVDYLRELYGSFALRQGWVSEVVSNKSNHVRLLIRSEQALAQLIGEIGFHNWNTVQGELGSAPNLYKADSGGLEKRRMIRAKVELSPFIPFQYKFNLADVEFEQYNSGVGNGGQKRNKTSSDIRAKHVPSGITIDVIEFRTQADNRRAAIDKLQEAVIAFYKIKHDEQVKNSFLRIQGIDPNRISRTYHLKENSIVGLDSKKRFTHAGKLENLRPEDVFPSIDGNSNSHFSSPANPQLETLLNQVIGIEGGIVRATDPQIIEHIQSEIDSLTDLIRR